MQLVRTSFGNWTRQEKDVVDRFVACVRFDVFFDSDESLFIGTKEGQLLVYVVRKTSKDSAKFDTTVDRTHKSFSKKPITQLEVIPEYHILISLSGKQYSRFLPKSQHRAGSLAGFLSWWKNISMTCVSLRYQQLLITIFIAFIIIYFDMCTFIALLSSVDSVI